jgi:hypothetical protein
LDTGFVPISVPEEDASTHLGLVLYAFMMRMASVFALCLRDTGLRFLCDNIQSRRKSEEVMSIVNRLCGALAVTIVAAGCASTQSEAFRKMSAEDHERAARAPSSGENGASAVEHASAAQQLREAELRACAEVPDADRDEGPFGRRDRVLGVQTVRNHWSPKAPLPPWGVAVLVRATPGVTEQWLGRVIECHRAHHAVVGALASERPCPLSVDEARVEVSSTSNGFIVEITSRDASAAREVVEKGNALLN